MALDPDFFGPLVDLPHVAFSLAMIPPSFLHHPGPPVRLPVPRPPRAIPSSDRAERHWQALDGSAFPMSMSRAWPMHWRGPATPSSRPHPWTDAQLRWAYVVLRTPRDLNSRYGKLFDVADRGLDHTTSNAPVSKTKAATGMHTDSSDAATTLISWRCCAAAGASGGVLLADAQGISPAAAGHPELGCGPHRMAPGCGHSEPHEL